MWTGAVHGQCPGVCPDYRVVSEGVWVGGEGPPQTGRGGQPSSHHIYNTAKSTNCDWLFRKDPNFQSKTKITK